jgi:hypothetical protein
MHSKHVASAGLTIALRILRPSSIPDKIPDFSQRMRNMETVRLKKS